MCLPNSIQRWPMTDGLPCQNRRQLNDGSHVHHRKNGMLDPALLSGRRRKSTRPRRLGGIWSTMSRAHERHILPPTNDCLFVIQINKITEPYGTKKRPHSAPQQQLESLTGVHQSVPTCTHYSLHGHFILHGLPVRVRTTDGIVSLPIAQNNNHASHRRTVCVSTIGN